MRKRLNVFGKKYRCYRFWAARPEDIRHSSIKELYRIFKELLPNHAAIEPCTMIYVFEEEEYTGFELLWVVEHFEDAHKITELATICKLMDTYLAAPSEWAGATIDLLDAFRQELIIHVWEPSTDVVLAVIEASKRQKKR